MNRRFVFFGLFQVKMVPIKEILMLVIFLQKFGECLQWVPIASPHFLQNSISHQLQIMHPPSFTPTWVKPSQNSEELDFRKPKTQTFYKWNLEPGRPPIYEFRYKVHDPKEQNYQEKSETRVGDTVRGYYSVREPDGYERLVKYVSDENGFKTQVSHHQADDNLGGFWYTMTRRVT